MAIDIEADNISRIIDSISNFFRISLNQGNDILTIREELELINAYFDIHEQRFPNRVSVIYELDDSVLSCEILKITLQPIVENAILHAFTGTNGYGELKISITHNNGDVLIKVTDDGCGMSKDIIESLFYESEDASNVKGFGIRNVHERLKKHFGEGYGLTILSEPEHGTTVCILIPLKEIEGEANADSSFDS